MTTSPQITAAELTAGTAALKASLAGSMPQWELNMVPAGAIEQAVATVVTAIDKVRDATPGDSNV